MAKKTKEITKEQLDIVINKYPPSNYIKFAFDYFSKTPVNEKFTIKIIINYILILLFLVGFLGTIFNISQKIILISTLLFSIVLVLFALYLYSVIVLNNIRINKICKELNISHDQYNELIEKYYK